MSWWCKACDARFSPELRQRCPVCGGPLVWDPGNGAEAPEAPPSPLSALTDEELFPLLDVTLIPRDGAIFIDSRDLIQSGWDGNLPSGGVYRVLVDGQTYYIEVLDYWYAGRSYLVREFKPKPPNTVPEAWLPKTKKKPRRTRKTKKES